MAKNVKIYSTPTCPFCIRAKQFLKDNNIVYEDIDVSLKQDKVRELMDKSGQMAVPVLDIDGAIVVGFDKSRMRELLGI
ncbi:MAG: glutaredoxin domain-containing protein [Candidatus Omnitrophota bacterium]